MAASRGSQNNGDGMDGAEAISHDETLRRLGLLADRALKRYDLPDGAVARLINLSENATYRVDDPASGGKWALRIHRVGYHSRTAIASELAWQAALKSSAAIVTPSAIPGRDGEMIQSVGHDLLAEPRNAVLFNWEAGSEPASNDVAGFELLGATAARMHHHVRNWQRPAWFTRHTWDFETSLGATPHWGRWQDGMGMTDAARTAIGETAALIGRRLERFGKSPARFNLIHGDMRLANLLMDGGTVKVIDFDDCGLSWFLYDCATTVSFFEHEPEVPELLNAWVRGYRRVGALSSEDEAEIETFVMLRRLLLVAWIGSHSETELAQSMGVDYTATTIPLCEHYLSRFGDTKPSIDASPIQPSAHKQRFWKRLP